MYNTYKNSDMLINGNYYDSKELFRINVTKDDGLDSQQDAIYVSARVIQMLS